MDPETQQCEIQVPAGENRHYNIQQYTLLVYIVDEKFNSDNDGFGTLIYPDNRKAPHVIKACNAGMILFDGSLDHEIEACHTKQKALKRATFAVKIVVAGRPEQDVLSILTEYFQKLSVDVTPLGE